MQTAYWQFCFSDRLTGARNPARLPTTIQSRRIRCAPTFERTRLKEPGWVLQSQCNTGGIIIGGMRTRRGFIRRAFLPALVLWAMAAWGAPMTKINIVVKTQGGHPVDRASVVVRFVQGHSIVKLGKAVRTTFELRTNQDGEAKIPSIPQGKIRVQVIAKGYQTFGEIFDVTEEE